MVYGSFPKLWVPFWGPYNKDCGILGSILGSPYFGKLPYTLGLKGFPCTYFKAQVYTIQLHGPFGKGVRQLISSDVGQNTDPHYRVPQNGPNFGKVQDGAGFPLSTTTRFQGKKVLLPQSVHA